MNHLTTFLYLYSQIAEIKLIPTVMSTVAKIGKSAQNETNIKLTRTPHRTEL